ncbi:hypothetical protein C5167_043198 [Papaver somniferum]|uniref:Uncharacterized protein n=1 Tax=Papaver somniferum TaxID=3469 RepID=A0A4Y7L510_PAPSO|nr:hypothetical protein C5167_043198 [Papaver somniferum]
MDCHPIGKEVTGKEKDSTAKMDTA